MKDIIESLSKHLSILVIILGAILFLVGVAGGVNITSFSTNIPDALGRISLAVVGLLLIIYGAVLAWKEQEKKDGSQTAVTTNSPATTVAGSQPVEVASSQATNTITPQSPRTDTCDSIGALVAPDTGLQEAIEFLTDHPDARKLLIWGFSMNWVKNFSSYLNDTVHKKLEVKIFIADEQMIGKNFNTLNVDDRKAIMHMRLTEWRQLAMESKVQSVSVYCHPMIPNDMGLIIDDQFALLGTYDWEQRGNELFHTRMSTTERKYLRLTDKTQTDKQLMKIFVNRFLCREFDASGKN